MVRHQWRRGCVTAVVRPLDNLTHGGERVIVGRLFGHSLDPDVVHEARIAAIVPRSRLGTNESRRVEDLQLPLNRPSGHLALASKRPL